MRNKQGARATRLALSAVVAAAMVVSMSPLGMIPVGQAAEMQAEAATITSEEIQAMLEAGDYAQGEAIVIIDNSIAAPSSKTAGTAAKELSVAEEIMQTDAETYEQATGDELSASSGEGVSIKHVVRGGMDTPTLLAELAQDPRVLSVEPNYLYAVPESEEQAAEPEEESSEEAYQAYNEDFDLSQWQWMSTYENGIMTVPDVDSSKVNGLNSPNWNDASAADNASCVVAIIDTGVDYNHPDLKDVMYSFSDELQQKLDCGEHGASFAQEADHYDPMDDHGHGTHCAGIVAAAWNGKGTSGMAKGAKIMAVKVSDASYTYPETALLEAYEFVGKAADAGVPVRVTSNSYGGGTPSPAQNLALYQLGEHGVISLFASGNERSNVDGGNDSNVFRLNPYTVVVNAERPDGKPSSFTNYGIDTDVFTPGVSILSTVPSFAATYFPPADETPMLYQGKASSDGTWNTGIVVSGASAATLPEAAGSGEIFENVTEENAIEISQSAAADASFEGDDESLVVTLGKVAAPKSEEDYYDEDFDPNVAKVIYLDFALPVEKVENAAFLGVSAYVMDHAGTWQFDGDASENPGKPTIETSILVKVKDESGAEGWVRDKVCYCKNEGTWEPTGFNLKNACGETKTNYVLDENGCLQVRLRLYGVAGVGFKEGTKIYLDSFGVGAKDTLANMPYAFWDGTSMACPAGAGAAAVLNKLLEAEKITAPERAARLCNLVKSCVKQADEFSGICSSGGQIDLSLLDDYGNLSMDKATPVINAATVDGGKAIIEGFGFGNEQGALLLDGEKIAIDSWTMRRNGTCEIVFDWPEGMKSEVKTVTVVRGDNGKSTSKYLLVSAPGASEQLYETQLGTDGLIANGTDVVACITGLDGVLYALTCVPVQGNHEVHYEKARLASYDAEKGKWKECAMLSCQLVGTPSMTSYEGKVIIAVTTWGEDEGAALFGYEADSGQLVSYDATNFPVSSAVANCEGELLVIGDVAYAGKSEESNSLIARWQLKETGTETPYEVTQDDILCTLNGSYYDPRVAVCADTIYIGSNSRFDSEDIGVAIEKVVWSADGDCAVIDYASRIREPWDEAEAKGKYDMTFGNSVFGLAASKDGPLCIGVDAYEGIGDNKTSVDADTFIMNDDAKGFEAFGKRFSFSSIDGVTACSLDGKLYVAALAKDEVLGYTVRATEIETAANPGDTDAGMAVGQTAVVDGCTYEVTGNRSVKLVKAASEKTVTVPANVTLNGLRYKVTGLAEDCFAGNDAQTVIVKSPYIEKDQALNCLRGSSVAEIVVSSAIAKHLAYKADYDNYGKYLKYVKANKAKKTAASKATKAKKNFNKAKKKLKKAKKKLNKAKKKFKKSHSAKAKKALSKAKKAYKKAKKNYKSKKKAYTKAKKKLATAKKTLASLKAYAGSKYKSTKPGYDKYIELKADYDKTIAACMEAYAFFSDAAVVGKSGVVVTK